MSALSGCRVWVGFGLGRVRGVLVGVVVVALTAVVLAGTGGWSPAGSAGAGSDGARAAVGGRADGGEHGLAGLPLAARGVVSSALGRGDSSYRVVGLRARNPVQRLSAVFSPAGATIASGAARVRLSLAAVGYASAPLAVGAALPRVSGSRVTYAHPGVREWWSNGPLGLEHGFDVRSRPSAGRGALTLAVAVAGDLRARLDRGGVVFSGRGATLRYGGLLVTDARSRPLPAWLRLSAGRVLIRIDDRGARYPVRVDPFVQQGSKLTASGETGKGQFGYSVALSADRSTALIGGTDDDNAVGAAWVFTRSGTSWTQQGPKLTASDETSYGGFGSSVALSADGNTALIGGNRDNNWMGAAWVFTRTGASWSQQGSKLTASDETGPGQFGYSVALSADGSTALIGGNRDNNLVGAAWVFTRSGTSWATAGLEADRQR